MELVPKLCLLESPISQSEPVYTVAHPCGTVRSDRSSSSSTISWGTESSLSSPHFACCRIKPPGSSPPLAAHMPANIPTEDWSYPTKSQLLHPVDRADSPKRRATGNWTDRACTALENALQQKSPMEVLAHDYTPVYSSSQVEDFITKADTVTSRRMIAAPLRQRSGLTSPNLQNIQRSISGFRPQPDHKLRIWFTARLNVFEPNDLNAVATSHQREPAGRLNSVSSWSLRSFIGLAFPEDATWALYENHRNGKITKALPFLRRSVYRCAWGSRAGEVYVPEVDIFPGSRLFVTYPRPDYAPEPLRRFLRQTGAVLRIDIVTVDRAAQRHALDAELARQNVPEDLWLSVIAKLHISRLTLSPSLQLKLLEIQCSWRSFLRKQSKPIEAYTLLYARCRSTMAYQIAQATFKDDNSLESLSRKVLEQCLRDMKLPAVHSNDFDLLWNAWRTVAGYRGIIHHSDYMRLAFGDLPAHRFRLMVQTFLRMDPNRSGHVKLSDMCQFYSPSQEARKQFGRNLVYSRNEFQNAFGRFTNTLGQVDFCEFEAFHQGVCIGLSDSLADSTSGQSDTELIASIVRASYPPPPNSDKFHRFMRLCWGGKA